MSPKELWEAIMVVHDCENNRQERLAKVRAELAVLGNRQQPKQDLLSVKLY